jgi:hypothetical protein
MDPIGLVRDILERIPGREMYLDYLVETSAARFEFLRGRPIPWIRPLLPIVIARGGFPSRHDRAGLPIIRYSPNPLELRN